MPQIAPASVSDSNTAVSVPAVSVPAISVPAVSVPAVSAAAVSASAASASAAAASAAAASAAAASAVPVVEVPVAPKFGTDRWSHQLNMELSDDDEDIDDEAVDDVETAKNLARADSGPASRSESARATPGLELESRRQEIKRLQEQIKVLEAKRKAKENPSEIVVSKTNNISSSPAETPVLANDTSSRVAVPTGSQLTVSGSYTNQRVPNIETIDAIQYALDSVLKKQQAVLQQREKLKAEIQGLSLENLVKDVEQMKRVLEDKVQKILDVRSRTVSFQAQLEATEAEQKQVTAAIQLLQEQLLKVTAPTIKTEQQSPELLGSTQELIQSASEAEPIEIIVLSDSDDESPTVDTATIPATNQDVIHGNEDDYQGYVDTGEFVEDMPALPTAGREMPDNAEQGQTQELMERSDNDEQANQDIEMNYGPTTSGEELQENDKRNPSPAQTDAPLPKKRKMFDIEFVWGCLSIRK
jgi:hypothetical protein